MDYILFIHFTHRISGVYKRGKNTIQSNIFTKEKDVKKMLGKGSIDLHQAFKNSYTNGEIQSQL